MWPTFFMPVGALLPGGLSPLPPYDVGCGTSNTLVPTTAFPGLAVGDLMVWQFNCFPGNWASNSDNVLSIPAGWTPFITPKFTANKEAEYSYAVLYRFATADDLDVGTSYVTSAARLNGYICSYCTAHRNANTEVPFGTPITVPYLVESTYDAFMYTPPVGGKQRIEHLLYAYLWRKVDGALFTGALPPTSVPLGPEGGDYHTFDSVITIPGSAELAHRLGMVVTTAYDDENWITNENPDQSLTDSAWTPFALDTLSRGGYDNQFTKFNASGLSSTRHYIEIPFSLTAGERYMFSFVSQRGDYNYAAANQRIAISFVDPGAVERGAKIQDAAVSALIDPSADHGTWWHAASFQQPAGGVPSVIGSNPVVYFTAQASGTHYMRISAVNGSNDLEFIGAGNEGWLVAQCLFRKGWRIPAPMYTYDSPIYSGESAEMQTAPTIGALVSGFSGSADRAFRAFPVYYSGGTEPCFVTKYGPMRTGLPYGMLLDDDDTSRAEYHSFASVGAARSSGVAPSHPVYPTIGGVRQKYYFEATSLQSGSSWGLCLMPVGVNPTMGTSAVQASGDAGFVYLPDGASAVSMAGAQSLIANDVLGGMVDFTTPGQITLTIYKNGTSLASHTITTGASKAWNDDEPWVFVVEFSRNTSTVSGHNFSVNVTGSFSYLPSGAVAWGAPTA